MGLTTVQRYCAACDYIVTLGLGGAIVKLYVTKVSTHHMNKKKVMEHLRTTFAMTAAKEYEEKQTW